MTIYLFFVTVTIQKHHLTNEEFENRNRIKSITEKMTDRKCEFYNIY
ncbi:YrzI family small protein [Bacillus marinisedimentorum]|nr:YrzI family small protein [Bacillus marinisedimentorum]